MALSSFPSTWCWDREDDFFFLEFRTNNFSVFWCNFGSCLFGTKATMVPLPHVHKCICCWILWNESKDCKDMGSDILRSGNKDEKGMKNKRCRWRGWRRSELWGEQDSLCGLVRSGNKCRKATGDWEYFCPQHTHHGHAIGGQGSLCWISTGKEGIIGTGWNVGDD